MASERESGFTLLEMLVALSVISIAALALIRLDAYAIRTAGDLDESTMAGIVAQNRAVELWTDPGPADDRQQCDRRRQRGAQLARRTTCRQDRR